MLTLYNSLTMNTSILTDSLTQRMGLEEEKGDFPEVLGHLLAGWLSIEQ